MSQSNSYIEPSTHSGLMVSANPQQQGLALNIFEVVLNTNEIEIFKIGYSQEAFDYCKAHYQEFYFYRFNDGEDRLFAWRKIAGEQVLHDKFKPTTITMDVHAPIFKKIIEESLVQFFKQGGYQFRKNKYSSSWEVTIKLESPKKLGHLSLIPTMVFSVTNLFSKIGNKQVIALSVQKEYPHRFTGNEAAIKSQNIDTRDWNRNRDGKIVASSRNRKIYLEATNQTAQYLNFRNQAQSSLKEYSFLKGCLTRFNDIKDTLFLPDTLKVTNFLFANLPNSSFESEFIKKPQYYFYNEKTSFASSYDAAVKNLKPYSYDLFASKVINILVVTPAEYEGVVDEHLVRIKKILETTFHLNSIKFEFLTVDGWQDYLTKLDDVDTTKYDLAIVVVSQFQKKWEIKKSPYYLVKAKLLNQRLPTQDLTIEVLKKKDQIVEKNIALNIYSKLGGTAWTIEQIEKNVTELIIGIGSTIDEKANMVIGFANIFDHNGTYLLGDCSQLSTKENYSKNLENYLIKGLKLAFEKKNISEGDSIRLVFHLFKEAGEEYEITAIENALNHFTHYSIRYALVHLSYNHNYRVFLNEGNKQPVKGTFVQVSTFQALLHLGKSAAPILLRVDKRSKYKDIYSITKQALFFLHLSHRTFLTPSKPVTITYPSRMAKIVSELRQVPNWDPAILNQISDKLWFI